MTSKNSSHNPFLFTFKRLFKQCLPLAIAPGAILAVYCVIIAIVGIVENGSIIYYASGAEMGVSSTLLETSQAFYLVMIVLSCVFGLIAFNFLNSKRECNLYLSLGISKMKLFWSRYLGAGAAVVICILGTQIFDALHNIMIGEMHLSAVNLKLWLLQTIYILVATLCAYSVTVLAFVNSGNVVEGIVFTFFYGIFPVIFASVSEGALGHLIYGSAYETDAYTANLTFTSKTWFLDIFGSITEGEVVDKLLQYGDPKNYEAPNMTGMFVCLVSFILIAVLASLFFKKRTSEISGTVFKSYNNYRIIAVLASILTFCGLTGSNISSRYLLADVCILIAILVFIAISAILTRKVSAKTAISLAVSMAVFCIVCFIGYGKSVPEVKDIESVDLLISNEQSAYTSGASRKVDRYYNTLNRYGNTDIQYHNLKTENDIEWIRDIHKDIVEDGYRSKLDDNSADAYIVISYNLKDGSNICRAYRYESMETYKKILGFMKTDKVADYNECLFNADPDIDSNYTEYSVQGKHLTKLLGVFNDYVTIDTYEPSYYAGGILRKDNKLFVGFNDSNNLYLGNKEVDLSKDSSLRDALYKDIKNQTVEQKYFHSSSDEIGYLTIIDDEEEIARAYEALLYYNEHKSDDLEYDYEHNYDWSGSLWTTYPDDNEYYDEELDEFVTVPDEDYVAPIDRETYKKNRDKAIEQFFKYGMENDCELTGENAYHFVITKDMVNTVKWLEDNGLYDSSVKNTQKPVKVRGYKFPANYYTGMSYQTTFISVMSSDYVQALPADEEYGNENYYYNSEYIDDPATVQSLLENSRLCAAKLTDNFVIEFVFEDGTRVTKYVSKYNVSDEVEAKLGYVGKKGAKNNRTDAVTAYPDRNEGVTYVPITAKTSVY